MTTETFARLNTLSNSFLLLLIQNMVLKLDIAFQYFWEAYLESFNRASLIELFYENITAESKKAPWQMFNWILNTLLFLILSIFTQQKYFSSQQNTLNMRVKFVQSFPNIVALVSFLTHFSQVLLFNRSQSFDSQFKSSDWFQYEMQD